MASRREPLAPAALCLSLSTVATLRSAEASSTHPCAGKKSIDPYAGY